MIDNRIRKRMFVFKALEHMALERKITLSELISNLSKNDEGYQNSRPINSRFEILDL